MQRKSERFFAGVCERVRTAAAQRQLTNLELSRLADVAYRTVYSVMRGTARPTDRVIGKFAKALNVSVQWLLTGNESQQPTTVTIQARKPGVVQPERKISIADAVSVLAEHFDLTEEEIMTWLAKRITDRKAERRREHDGMDSDGAG